MDSSFITGLFTKDEWQLLVITVALTFAVTHFLKLVYRMVVPVHSRRRIDIEMAAIVAGVISASLVWPELAISMHWPEAGILSGASSILLYKVLKVVSTSNYISTKYPFIRKVLKGGNHD